MEGLRRGGGRSEGEEGGSKSGESYGAAVRWLVVNERCESLDWGGVDEEGVGQTRGQWVVRVVGRKGREGKRIGRRVSFPIGVAWFALQRGSPSSPQSRR